YAAVFEAADPPRTSTIAFYAHPDGGPGLPADTEVVVAGPDGARRSAPAVRVPLTEAIPLLSRARPPGPAPPPPAVGGGPRGGGPGAGGPRPGGA
ncbi:hypothetical protein K7G98_39185, partial [Saccharothrix sp. MB29]|nr:hypothetical protein [Saccharothrix sp. MB29]